MPPADSPYSFLVSLGLGPDGAPTPTSARTAHAAGGAGAQAVGGGDEEEAGGCSGVVPLLKDPASGRVRVQVAAAKQRGEVLSVVVKRRQGGVAVLGG